MAALAGLAIAKEKIVIADLARRNRGYKTDIIFNNNVQIKVQYFLQKLSIVFCSNKNVIEPQIG